MMFFIGLPSFAKAPPESESHWSEEAWDNFKSPFTTKGKYILMGGAGLTASLLFFEDQIIDPVQHETVEDKPLGATSKFGDLGGQGVPNAIYAAGMLTYGLLAKNSESLRDASGMLQATTYSFFTTTLLKTTVREPRPYNSHIKTSFPSGHTAAAFAFASYVGCRHSLGWGVAAYSLATFVGFSRMNDDAHYLHDVVAGAAIGGSYGLGVCLAENRRKDVSSWYVSPTAGGVLVGFASDY